jgi:hypothetical protein
VVAPVSPSCSADISGFFAGDGGTQIGAAYAVNIGNGEIKGVAALGIGSLSSSSVLPNGQLYTMARTGGANPIEGDYFTGDPMSGALEAEFGSSGELLYAQSVYPLTQTQLGTHVPGSPAAPITNAATAVDIGTYKTLSWGRYTNGDVMVDGQTVTLSGPSSEHYVIGQETPSNMMSNLGYYGGTALLCTGRAYRSDQRQCGGDRYECHGIRKLLNQPHGNRHECVHAYRHL